MEQSKSEGVFSGVLVRIGTKLIEMGGGTVPEEAPKETQAERPKERPKMKEPTPDFHKKMPVLETKKGLQLCKEYLEVHRCVSQAGIRLIRLNRFDHHRFVFPGDLYLDWWPDSRRRSLYIPDPACVGRGKLSREMERWSHYGPMKLAAKMVEWQREREKAA